MMGVRFGSLAASGDQFLGVCFHKISRHIRGLKIFLLKPGYFSKADTENPKLRGNLRPAAVTRGVVHE
jgi:hypothetical protein